MVEPIYCLKPAWCGRHLAGLRPETGLTVRYGATAFKAVGYHLTGNKQALEVVQGMAHWADTWTASKSEEHMQAILETEYGGMNEVLYNISAATNDDRWA